MPKDELTRAKTLWSETVLEVLYESLRKGKNDFVIKDLLKEAAKKGFEREYILDRAGKKVGPTAVSRLRHIFSTGTSQ